METNSAWLVQKPMGTVGNHFIPVTELTKSGEPPKSQVVTKHFCFVAEWRLLGGGAGKQQTSFVYFLVCRWLFPGHVEVAVVSSGRTPFLHPKPTTIGEILSGWRASFWNPCAFFLQLPSQSGLCAEFRRRKEWVKKLSEVVRCLFSRVRVRERF